MCHSAEEHPRVRAVGGAAADHGDFVLTSTDGAAFAAYFARAARPSGDGIVVAPDAGGLSNFYKELARRLAEAGIDAVTIDYYGRTAGSGARPAGFNGDDHMAQTTPGTVDADVEAGAAYLRSATGGAVHRVFCVGFCFGGAVAWRQSRNGLDGGIGFYGSGAALRESVADLKTLRAPLLLLVAGKDKYFPLEDSMKTDRALEAAGVAHETVVYENAPHGFFSDGEHVDICDDAWRRLLDFVKVGPAA
jgi:carboxymethylenebutenolidase